MSGVWTLLFWIFDWLYITVVCTVPRLVFRSLFEVTGELNQETVVLSISAVSQLLSPGFCVSHGNWLSNMKFPWLTKPGIMSYVISANSYAISGFQVSRIFKASCSFGSVWNVRRKQVLGKWHAILLMVEICRSLNGMKGKPCIIITFSLNSLNTSEVNSQFPLNGRCRLKPIDLNNIILIPFLEIWS